MATCASLIENVYASSRWQAAYLPIRYKVQSERWPVNTVDSLDAFGSISGLFGYCQIELTGTYESYLLGEYVQITNSTASAYDGIWRIREIIDANTIVVNCPFSTTASGNIQRYYNNYQIQARVYVGIPSGHYYNSSRPISLKTESLPGIPDSDNIATIDISDFVRQDLGIAENNICQILESGEWIANDWASWTAFYCEFREAYDVPDESGLLVTEYTSWEDLGTTTYYATRSALPFQSLQGVNMGGYSMLPNSFDITGKWMTGFETPTFFSDQEFDIAIISTEDNLDRYNVIHYVNINQYDKNGSLIRTDVSEMPFLDEGVYRFVFSELAIWDADTDYFEVFVQRAGTTTQQVSKTITVKVKPENCRDYFYVRWLNQLGGWDAWRFDGYVVKGIDTGNAVTIRRDIWRNYDSDFATGSTIDDYISRQGKETRTVTTAFLDEQESKAFVFLRAGIKVQEVYFADEGGCEGFKRRTWLIENNPFTYYDPADKRNVVTLKFIDTAPMFIQGQ